MRGINETSKIKTRVSDKIYKLDIIGFQETHMKGSGITTHISIKKLTNSHKTETPGMCFTENAIFY